MSAIDLHAALWDAAKAVSLVRSLADQAQAMAITDSAERPEMSCLAATLGSLADAAMTAAVGIDYCLTSASSSVDGEVGGGSALAEFEAAHNWAVLLRNVVETAVVVYAEACALLADRVALAEEYGSIAECQRGLAAVLVAAARALTAPRCIGQSEG